MRWPLAVVALLLLPAAAAIHTPVAAKDKREDLIVVGTQDLASPGPGFADILDYDARVLDGELRQRVWFNGTPLDGAHAVNMTIWFRDAKDGETWAVSAVARNASVEATAIFGSAQFSVPARHAVRNDTVTIWWNASIIARNTCFQPFIASWPGPPADGATDVEDVLFPVEPDCDVRNPRSRANATEPWGGHDGPRFITSPPPSPARDESAMPGGGRVDAPWVLAILALVLAAWRRR